MPKEAVGYKKPPPKHQFQPGTSGNPSGRPKKLPSMRERVAAELAKRVRVVDDGLELSVSKQDALAKALVDAALNGNQRAMSAVIALCDGSPADDQHASDDADESLVEDHIEREVKRRSKERTTSEEDSE